MNKSIVLAVSGASGIIYSVRLLELLLQHSVNIHLVITSTAEHIAREELSKEQFILLTRDAPVRRYDSEKYSVEIASGSYHTDGMVIIPASMGTCGRIANGTSDNLVVRSADVHLKEKRKLIIVPRETPLNRIHLENLLKLNDAGAVVLPAMPSFYSNPADIDDLVDTVVARILDMLEINHDLNVRYNP